MNVALINTNRYLHPPTIPVGLEYLVRPLELAGHRVTVCDLSFSEKPLGDILPFLEDPIPDAIGLSVRNVDSVTYLNNVFFLDEIAELIGAVKDHVGGPVIVGGSATLCSREPLREFLDADYLVSGPGEMALPGLLEALEGGTTVPTTIDGWSRGIVRDLTHPRARYIDYAPYVEDGNPAGLEFRKGCNWNCPFCVERGKPVLSREISAVIDEAVSLAEAGVRSVFLSDPEVNQDLDETNAFLSALGVMDLGLDWTGYFRPLPFDARMARLASDSGCKSLTVSVNSWDISGEGGRYDASDVVNFLGLCGDEGIRVAVDLMVGYPGESRGSVEDLLELLSEARPATVGVSHYIRLYEEVPVSEDAATVDGRWTGAVEDNPGMIKPVFFSCIDEEWLESRISSDPLFVLEGRERTVNYQRL